MQERSIGTDRAVNRRRGLATGAKLAFAAPAVVAALRAPAAAFACGDVRNASNDDDCGDHGAVKVKAIRNANQDTDTGTQGTFDHTTADDDVRSQTAGFDCVLDAKLAKVAGANASLDRGGCKVFTSNGVAQRIFVRMRRARRRAEHRLVFCGRDGVNHVLAAFHTNDDGDCRTVVVAQPVLIPVADGTVHGRCIVQARVNGQFVTHFVASRIVWF